MTQTHKMNAQAAAKPSPALRAAWRIMKARGLEMFAHEANELAAIIEDETKTDPRCVAFNQAGRALGVDAAELGESINLVAIFDALEHSLVYLEAQHKAGTLNDPSGQLALGQTRAQLAKLPKPAQP